MVEFTVVDLNLSYNVILGRPSLNASHSIIVGEHLKVKFSVENEGMGEMLGDQAEARSCSMNALKFKAVRVVSDSQLLHTTPMSVDLFYQPIEPLSGSVAVSLDEMLSVQASSDSSDFDPRVESPDMPHLRPAEETIPVQLMPDRPDRVTFVGAGFGSRILR